jgi:hypothetical protein
MSIFLSEKQVALVWHNDVETHPFLDYYIYRRQQVFKNQCVLCPPIYGTPAITDLHQLSFGDVARGAEWWLSETMPSAWFSEQRQALATCWITWIVPQPITVMPCLTVKAWSFEAFYTWALQCTETKNLTWEEGAVHSLCQHTYPVPLNYLNTCHTLQAWPIVTTKRLKQWITAPATTTALYVNHHPSWHALIHLMLHWHTRYHGNTSIATLFRMLQTSHKHF